MDIVALSALVFASTVCLVAASPLLFNRFLGSRLRRTQTRTEQALQTLFISDMSAADVALLFGVAAAALGALVFFVSGSLFPAVAAAGVSLLLRKPLFEHLKALRVLKLEEQLPGALDLLTSYTRSGLSLTQALEELAKNCVPPISQELQMIVQETQIGADVGGAIENARTRIGSRTFGLVATALQVSRSKGGNLTEALDRMTLALREIWRLEQKLITASAEARKATWIISGAPIGIAILVLILQPDMAYALVETIWGLIFLGLSGVMYSLGLWWLLRAMKVSV